MLCQSAKSTRLEYRLERYDIAVLDLNVMFSETDSCSAGTRLDAATTLATE